MKRKNEPGSPDLFIAGVGNQEFERDLGLTLFESRCFSDSHCHGGHERGRLERGPGAITTVGLATGTRHYSADATTDMR
jgi:hypothetical protein